jgi:hypothetical protein
MSKTVNTPKGTSLPLISLKGKDYLMVAHRFVWFNEVETKFDIDTKFLHLDDEQTVCQAKVVVKDKDGNVIKSASATKRETKKDFSDHTEKAETSAVGRALAMLGYGTQFAIADLDEGDRLADSPVANTKATSGYANTKIATPEVKSVTLTNAAIVAVATPAVQATPETAGKTSYRKPTKRAAEAVTAPAVSNGASADSGDGWN